MDPMLNIEQPAQNIVPQPEPLITNKSKWIGALILGAVFLLISNGYTYKATNWLTSLVGIKSSKGGCPNWIGLLLHAVVFILVVRLLMN